MAASPQPPSLQLPKPVHDLTASRAGNRVNLHWTTPSETTDKLKIHRPVSLQICREEKSDACQNVATISASPGSASEYMEILPAAVTSGPLRPATYRIFGLNKHGRNAGPSNPAATLVGEAPPRVEHLSATMEERGVLLRWQTAPNLLPGTSIQLERTLLTPTTSHSTAPTGIPLPAESTKQKLEISLNADGTDPGTALDSNAAFNNKYQYVAMRVVGQKNAAQELQVSSLPSEPVLIVTRDTFPPVAPIGVVAVPVSAAINNGVPEVDLSWSANTEPDIAQYFVYRRNIGTASAEQIGPENSSAPIVAPTFRDTHVQPGATYIYYVVAVDNSGNRSNKSAEVTVTVPGAS